MSRKDRAVPLGHAGPQSTKDDFAAWNAQVGRLLSCEPQAFPSELLDAATALSPVCISYLGTFGEQALPHYFHQFRSTNAGWSKDFRPAPYYVFDPFYSAFRGGASGPLFLKDIQPDGFEDTEYFRQIYQKFDLVDEMVHLAPGTDGNALVLGLARSSTEGPFTPSEISLHSAVHPVFSACLRNFQRLLPKTSATPKQEKLRHIEQAFEHFGEGILTKREREVVRLVLHGHNTASVAQQLEISPETVKLHRKKSYAKLRINSQGELFYKFLEELGLEHHDRIGVPETEDQQNGQTRHPNQASSSQFRLGAGAGTTATLTPESTKPTASS